MLTNKAQAIAMSAVRDQLLASLARHEKEEHGGQPCIGNRLSAIAYLAHCLGADERHLCYIGKVLAEYNANCPGNQCPHTELE